MKKIVLVILMSLMFVGCTSNNTAKTVEITHKLGVSDVPTNPSKVVIFDMGIVDIYNALDLDIIGLPKANLPTNLNMYNTDQYTDVGSFFEPNFEAISLLEPELIIISGRASKQYDALSEIAPTIYLGNDSSDEGAIASVQANLETLKLIYPNINTDEISQNLNQAVETLHKEATASNQKTMFILANGNEITTFSKGSRYDILFNEFGFTPLIEESDESTHGIKLSFEEIYNLNPEVIVVMDRSAVTGGEGNAKELLDNEFVKGTKSYQNNKIIYVDPNTWYLTEGGYNAILSMTQEITPLTK